MMARRTGWLLAACVGIVAGGLGCSTKNRMFFNPHADNETLGQTAHEHERDMTRVAEHDRRLLIEDLDLFFQTDRPTRLTRWHIR